MGTRTRYEPGTFSWVELATTDPDDAKRFYGELFGWQTDEIPGGGVYTMARLDGETVAGITEQPEPQRAAGVPPNWFNYVTVAGADESAARASPRRGPASSAARCTPARSTSGTRRGWRSSPIPPGRCSGSGKLGARSARNA